MPTLCVLLNVEVPSKRRSLASRVWASIGSGLNEDGGTLTRNTLGGGIASAVVGGAARVDAIGEDEKANSEIVSRGEGARRSCTSG